MKIEYKAFLIGLVIGAMALFIIKKPNIKEVKVPFKVEVKVPVIEKEFDTIYLPIPTNVTDIEDDNELLKEYEKANDSLKKELFKKSVSVKEYKEVFDDSIQTITVDLSVTGTLNSIFTKYKTKPRTVLLDTVLTVDVPNYNRSISAYGEVGMPTNKYVQELPIFKVGIDVSNKKNFVYGASFDTEKRVWIKLGKKWNF